APIRTASGTPAEGDCPTVLYAPTWEGWDAGVPPPVEEPRHTTHRPGSGEPATADPRGPPPDIPHAMSP
ncbi:hypothetical protein ABZ782_36705, partial [Streptomyces asoensis]|uniref:hypothetical protein n=1 Tax=Streptomyces asoensis TaxID=249586 RepID=UPI0033E17FBA